MKHTEDLAAQAWEDKEFTRAAELYGTLRAEQPGRQDVVEREAESYHLSENHEKAIELCNSYASQVDATSRLFYVWAESLVSLDRKDEAIKLLESIAPGDISADLILHRSAIRFLVGDYVRSLEDTNKVLATDRSNILALYNRGMAYRGLGRLWDAKADFLLGLDLSSNSGQKGFLGMCARRAAECLVQLGEKDKALQLLHKAVLSIDDCFPVQKEMLRLIETLENNSGQ